ncbi:hypothetical protein QAD02_005219 [Eretmocerus hayati]|uniref:Uncharacterized protein n=1 Tax=Eretmocerus hayati TaxID=131215 RepID=A0ACC2NS69_9HYME|nr:hypothetical protein QAD02_005219 [Eretmocerus hayati]
MKRARIKAVASVPIRRKATQDTANANSCQREVPKETSSKSQDPETKPLENDVKKITEEKSPETVVEQAAIRVLSDEKPAETVIKSTPLQEPDAQKLLETVVELASAQEVTDIKLEVTDIESVSIHTTIKEETCGTAIEPPAVSGSDEEPAQAVAESVSIQEPAAQETADATIEPSSVQEHTELKPVVGDDAPVSSQEPYNPELSSLETEEYSELQSCGQSIASNEVFNDIQLVNDIEIGISEDLEILSSGAPISHDEGHKLESDSDLEHNILSKFDSPKKSSIVAREGSPIKMRNRSCFMRPSPRLDGGGRIRRNSVQSSGASASESEDDSRRSSSVASSRTFKENSTNNATKSNSNQKRKTLVSDTTRKIGASEASVQEKKVSMARARREFFIKHDNKPPDKSKLTMYDLIYYNPTTNPMKPKPASSAPRKISVSSTQENNDKNEDEPAEESSEMVVPQVKVGPNGQLIIDEQSLVIDQYKAQENIDRSDIIVDEDTNGSGFYKKRPKSKDWNKWETIKFYKALSTYGTDFLLMQSVFPQRTRQELKLKYKREERTNIGLIEKALLYQEFDTEALDKDLEDLDESIRKESKSRKSRRPTSVKRKRKRCSELHQLI